MASVPRSIAGNAPDAPVQTARDASSSASIAMTASTPRAASAGDAAILAPAFNNGSARRALRFHTTTAKPPSSRRRAMAAPMIPRPRKAIRFIRHD